MADIYEDYKGQGLEIVSISKDENQKQREKAIAKDGVGDWIHIWDEDESISQQYSVSSLPQNVVISPAGKVVAKNVSSEDLNALLEKKI